VKLLKENADAKTRHSIRNDLQGTILIPNSSEPEKLKDEIIAFAASSWLMVKTSNWKPDQTLKDFVSNELLQTSMQTDKVKLPRTFNARNLSRLAGIEVHWTYNLADHLRMINDESQVSIFHFASLLEWNKSSKW
jgi:hypothetical protein